MNENEISKIERRIDARIGVGVKKIIGVTGVLFVLLAFGISSPIMWQFGQVNTKFDEVKALVEKNTAAIRQLSESINVKNKIEAAKQGSAIAQFNLGLMYAKGEGVPQDYVEAYAWVLLAKAKGNEHASEKISILEKRLTAEQMEKGQARAKELRRSIGAK